MQSIDSIETYAYETIKNLVSEKEGIKSNNIIKLCKKWCYRGKYKKNNPNWPKSFDSKGFIEYSSNVDNIYKNIDEYNPNKKWKILIVFDYMIADMLSNKNLDSIVPELFIRGGKLNIFLVSITHILKYQNF